MKAAALVIAVLATTSAASAQTQPSTTYGADYYTAFAPQTALDMVRRTPGVVLDDGDADLRGFGASGGNVLIDGARPSSKGGVIEALERIPAAQVERIEVLRSAVTGEAQGQALVLNVIRSRIATSGAWSFEVERNANNIFYPRAQFSRTQAWAGWETSVRANVYWEEFPFRGYREARDAEGTLISTMTTDLPSTVSEASLSGDARRTLGGGTLNLTARAGTDDYHYGQPGELFLGREPDGNADQRILNTFDRDRWSAEVGADFTRPLAGGGSWKLLGLINYRDGVEDSEEVRRNPAGAVVSRSRIAATARPLEAVGRFTLDGAGGRRTFGAEVAYNRFDRTFALEADDGSGTGYRPVPIPAANVTVEEVRAETFAETRIPLGSHWTLEGGLAAEASRISVSGDADQSRDFVFIKPSAAIVWRPSDRLQLRLAARRRVGQLSFTDFAASARLDEDTSTAGNPDLGPDQATRYSASVDYRGGSGLALNVEIFHEQRRDVLEQVILPSGAPGLANAGEATVTGVKYALTAPLDRWLAGARFTSQGEIVDSRFDDPLTGRERALSRVYSPVISAEFRHDIPGAGWSWGLTAQAEQEGTLFTTREIDEAITRRYFGAFVETSALGAVKARLVVVNLDGRVSDRLRRFYSPDRSGLLSAFEERQSRSPMRIALTFSGAF